MHGQYAILVSLFFKRTKKRKGNDLKVLEDSLEISKTSENRISYEEKTHEIGKKYFG